MQKSSGFRWVLALSLIVAFFSGYIKLFSPDIFWHIQVGAYFSGNDFFQQENLFSWSFASHPWYSTYWLFSRILSFIHAYSGYTGLSVYKIFLIITFSVIYSINIFRRSQSPLISICLLIMFVDISLFRFMLRPHIYTFMGLIIILAYEKTIFEMDLSFNNKAVMCIIFTLWTNLHSGVIFGLLMLSIILFNGLINKRNALKERILFLSMIFISTIINPNGYRYLIYLFDHLNMDEFIIIDELSAFLIKDNLRYFYMMLLLYIIPCFSLKNRKEIFTYILIISPVNFYLLIKGKRFIPITVIFSTIPWFYFRRSFFNKLKNDKIIYSILLSLSLSYITALHSYKFAANDEMQSGTGVNYTQFPVEEVKILEQRGIKKVFNSIGIGGFLIGESKVKPFIDGRIHAYPFSVYREIYKSNLSEEAFQQFLNKWEFDAVLVDPDEYYINKRFFTENWEIKTESPFFMAVKVNR